jgi:hypothetical protein
MINYCQNCFQSGRDVPPELEHMYGIQLRSSLDVEAGGMHNSWRRMTFCCLNDAGSSKIRLGDLCWSYLNSTPARVKSGHAPRIDKDRYCEWAAFLWKFISASDMNIDECVEVWRYIQLERRFWWLKIQRENKP